ncbi:MULTISPECIES: hypothetical protein [Corynebacterium]|uniref:DUF393 domain-containing protein n=1 Tax=Corynebacterium glucuronolyticum TaxID=39791 RepID=A0A7T4JV13_9CORY|nr:MULTISPECIES: hypothetical protein [Corynebacterium]MCT1562841.1 DUF393 domain-containing protein [Corynebacterium glucuronolyticum]OFO49596.1 hypothetical protein HMPREF3044_07440 [Corynebacterium sp. HMSC073D01]QQB46380.1 hypothetical protein I6I10_13270 [Corynebacterium glucuronolyticum]QRO81658.1 hypothetical protein I6J20_07020 [Corynebacterium glucuronolyticum]
MSSTFYFDGNCRFCARSARVLVRLTQGLTVEPAPLADTAVYRSPAGVTYELNESIGRALAHHGRCVAIRLAGRMLCWPVFAPVYRFVAAHRSCAIGTLARKNS